MICLIEYDHEASGKERFLTRLRRRLSGDTGVKCRKITVLGMPVLYLTMPAVESISEKSLRRRTDAAAMLMHQWRIGRVVFAKDFPYRAQILREGFEEADGTVLTELLAGEIACQVCQSGKTAVIFASRLTGNAARAPWKVCAPFRYVYAVTAVGADALFDDIRRKAGVSVITDPSPIQLKKADVALIFDTIPGDGVLPETCVAIPVGRTMPEDLRCRTIATKLTYRVKNANGAEVPEGFPADRLIACALEAGTLRTEDIRVESAGIQLRPSAGWYR